MSGCPWTEPTDLRFRYLATRPLSVAAERSSPAQSTARRESVKRVESVEGTPRRTDLFRDCRGRDRVSGYWKRYGSLGIRTEFEHLSRQLDMPAVGDEGRGSTKLASTRSSEGAFGGVGAYLYSNSSSLYLSEYEMRSTRS